MRYKLLLIFALSFQIYAIELPEYVAKYSYESEEINIDGIRKFSKNSINKFRFYLYNIILGDYLRAFNKKARLKI